MRGLSHGLLKNGLSNITIMTNKFYPYVEEKKIFRIFFPLSEKMTRTKIRSLLRGVEYFFGWIYTVFVFLKIRPNVFHVLWLLNYKLDIIFLYILKKVSRKTRIVYTAHNILPHNNGEQSKDDLERIYNLSDHIIVHGEELKLQLYKTFPGIRSVVSVKYHGVKQTNFEFTTRCISNDIVDRINSVSSIYLFLGNINYSKGVDILYKCWKKIKKRDALLVIAGRKLGEVKILDEYMEEIKKDATVLFLPMYLEDNLVNYLLSSASAVILPYRNGSVSGVLFSAYSQAKPVLSTRFGAMCDYINHGETGFICDNNYHELLLGMKTLLNTDKKQLAKMGNIAKKFSEINFDWRKITNETIKDC